VSDQYGGVVSIDSKFFLKTSHSLGSGIDKDDILIGGEDVDLESKLAGVE